MRKIIYSFLILSFLHVFGQEVSDTSGCVPLSLDFSAPSGLSSFYWDFKNGQSSDKENPTVQFLNAGTYNVELREGQNGPIVGTVEIVAYDVPTPSFELINEVDNCETKSVTFIDNTTLPPGVTINRQLWQFFTSNDDALGTSLLSTPTQSFASSDTYKVDYTIETIPSECNNSAVIEFEIDIRDVPEASFTTIPGNLVTCSDELEVTFVNNSTGDDDLLYQWSVNGIGVSNDKDLSTSTFTQNSTIDLEVSYSNGCEVSAQKSIVLGGSDNAPLASFTTSPDVAETCADELELSFANTSTSVSDIQYEWSINGVVVSTNENLSERVFSENSTVLLKVTDNDGCESSFQKSVVVNGSLGVPDVSFSTTPNSTISCEDSLELSFSSTSDSVDISSYSWLIGGVNVGDTEELEVINFQQDTTVELIVSYVNGCVGRFAQEVLVGSPIVDFTIDTDTVCSKDQNTTVIAEVVNSSSGSYTWNATGGEISGTSLMPKLTFPEGSGNEIISLTITDTKGCSTTKYDTIHVYNLTTPTLTVDTNWSCTYISDFTYSVDNYQPDLFDYSWSDGTKTVTYTNDEDELYYGVNGSTAWNPLVYVTKYTKDSLCSVRSDSTPSVTIQRPNALVLPTTPISGCAPLEVGFQDASSDGAFFDFSGLIEMIIELTSDSTLSMEDLPPELAEFVELFFGDLSGLSEYTPPIVEYTLFDGRGDSLVLDSFKDTVTFSYDEPGTYPVYIKILTDKGCVDSSYSFDVVVSDPIDPTFEVTESEVCVGEEITLYSTTTVTEETDYHFITDEGRAHHCPEDSSLVWRYDYGVSEETVQLETMQSNCSSVSTQVESVNVIGATSFFDYEFDCSSPMEAQFVYSGEGATQLEWSIVGGVLDTTIVGGLELDTLDFVFTDSTDYEITLLASNGATTCTPQPQSRTLSVRPSLPKITSTLTFCKDVEYSLSGDSSSNVNVTCYDGYLWESTGQLGVERSTTPQNTVVFNTIGSHTISLQVDAENGCQYDTTIRVRVYDVYPSLEVFDLFGITSDLDICNPDTLDFRSTSTGDTTLVEWRWNLGDNSGDDLGENVEHIFDTPPSSSAYNCSLVITDVIGCQDQINFSIDHYTPKTSIIGDLTRCIGDTVFISAADFTDKGQFLNFEWDFGNGATSVQISDSVYYTETISYDISLKFTENVSGCGGEVTGIVDIQGYPEAGYSFPTSISSDGVCIGGIGEIEDSSQSNFPISSSSYYWKIGSKEYNTMHTGAFIYDEPGLFQAIHYLETTYGCRDSVVFDLKVNDPLVDFEITSTQPICKGDSLEFEVKNVSDVDYWEFNFGDGNEITGTTDSIFTHVYDYRPTGGLGTASIIAYGFLSGCNDSQDESIFIIDLFAGFGRNGGDSSMCIQLGEYVFTDSTSEDVENVVWDFGDGSAGFGKDISHIYENPGVYTVQQSVSAAGSVCADTVRKDVVILPDPVLTVVGDSVCEGQTSTLLVVDSLLNTEYVWSPSESLSSSTGPKVISSALASTTYTVAVEDSNTCTAIDSVELVVVSETGFSEWSPDTFIVVGDMVVLPVEVDFDIYQLHWSPDDYAISCIDCNYPVVQPLVKTVYELLVTDVLNCYESEYAFDIKIRPETFVKMPDNFTPNDDGVNDVLSLYGWGVKELVSFEVYDRWGVLVWEAQDVEDSWDGKHDGILQNADVYVYKIEVTTWTDEIIQEEGYINLIH